MEIAEADKKQSRSNANPSSAREPVRRYKNNAINFQAKREKVNEKQVCFDLGILRK